MIDTAWEPAWLSEQPALLLALQGVLALLFGLLVHAVVDRVMRRLSHHAVLAARLVRFTRRPAQMLLPLLCLQAVIGDQPVQTALPTPRLSHWVGILIILCITSLVIRLVQAAESLIEDRYPVNGIDNLRARSVRTQTRVLTRTLMFVVGLIGAASVLMTFPSVRQIGTSLLASAGVAGIAAGLAARPVLGNLIAGIQIALTQPIRLDDVLIVEGEWGRVEEITATYVVVRIWDDRRLIVPLAYFIEQPFQNWTRRTADLIGSVFFWVDHAMPVAALREALQRLCEADPDWDRRVCVLQVTDTSERAVQLRALVSSRDAGSSWDLRCRIREQLIAHMQVHYPQYLPQTRNRLLSAADQSDFDTHPSATGPSVQHSPIAP